MESGSLNGLELLSREKLWNREGLEHSIDVAARKKDMEISAFLMNERSRMMAVSYTHLESFIYIQIMRKNARRSFFSCLIRTLLWTQEML